MEPPNQQLSPMSMGPPSSGPAVPWRMAGSIGCVAEYLRCQMSGLSTAGQRDKTRADVQADVGSE